MGRNQAKRSHAAALSSANSSSNNNNNDNAWTAADHAARQKKAKTAAQERRRAILSHETKEKRDDIKLKLHITRVQREIAALKARLEAWDPVEEAEAAAKRKQEKRQAAAAAAQDEPPKKRPRRKGPEFWKLKGAARPAWQVYDFDTRYVDPHIQAHKAAKEKAQRSINILSVHKGQLATQGPDEAREYLALLMQLGYLQEDARKFKSARAAWLQCMELEGSSNPITTARESLMRLYLRVNRPDDALQLGQRLLQPKQDGNNDGNLSVWICYSTALVAFQKQHAQTMEYMRRAVQVNPLTAYYLAFLDIFAIAMEYTHDIHDADNEPESSLEEAIEYCSSGQEKKWQECGAADKLRNLLLETIQGQATGLKPSDVDWDDRLTKLQEELDRRRRLREIKEAGYYGPGEDGQDEKPNADDNGDAKEKEVTDADDSDQKDDAPKLKDADKEDDNDDDDDDDDDDEAESADDDDDDDEGQEPVDVSMYIGMFRTACEMVQEEGWHITI